ncbi:MAG: hypothetical protein ACRCXL_08875, partial [Dermatophilaceae bacterium]
MSRLSTVVVGAVVVGVLLPLGAAPDSGADDRKKFAVRGTAVAGGPSLIDAAKLKPGVYNDTIRQGEVLWYSVDLARAEGVIARLTIRTAGVPTAASVQLDWVDAATDRLASNRLDGVGTGGASTLAARTGVMDGSRAAAGALREPGTHYLSVRVGGFPAKARHPFVLEMLRDGQETADAAEGSVPSSGETAADDALGPVLEPEPVPPTPSSDGSPVVLLVAAFGA